MNYLGSFPQISQDKIKHIASLLAPYTARAYLVGGCVRDMFLNKSIKDFDIEIYDISTEDFDTIMQKIGAKGVGKSFFVYKLDDIDLALPRIEKKIGIGHKAFKVELVSDERRASKRRDFTMNAMMINIFNGKFLDFWKGHDSIINKTISLIDEKSFKEDSLRVLRAIQFSARFGFEIERYTLAVMNTVYLHDLSSSRIFWELEKLFKADFLFLGFIYIHKLEIFEKLFTCSIKNDKYNEIIKELKEVQSGNVVDIKEYYFLYIVANMSNINLLTLLKKMKAPNRYLNTFKNQPFYDKYLSDKELAIIAIDLPIKNWLGNYKKNIITRAKELKIYDSVYSRGMNIQDVIKDGFEKQSIKIEYRRRLLEKIDKEFYDG